MPDSAAEIANKRRLFRRRLAQSVRALSERSAPLRAWIETCGPCTLEIRWEQSPYESLVRAIAHQQLHGRAAQTILGRLQAGFRGDGFPEPKQLARVKLDKLRRMGFSAAKAAAIQGIAAATIQGQVPDRAEAERLSDAELIQRLVALKGVGVWTVEMLLIFTLGRLDVMPADDFGVKTGLKLLLELPDLPKKPAFAEHTAAWSPHRSVAAWYLWRRADAAKSPA
ncbi:MAG: hypothetical protein AMXMBFR7_47430 [Planctomycetota bacterium]